MFLTYSDDRQKSCAVCYGSVGEAENEPAWELYSPAYLSDDTRLIDQTYDNQRTNPPTTSIARATVGTVKTLEASGQPRQCTDWAPSQTSVTSSSKDSMQTHTETATRTLCKHTHRQPHTHKHTTHNTQHTTQNIQPHNPQHTTHNTQHTNTKHKTQGTANMNIIFVLQADVGSIKFSEWLNLVRDAARARKAHLVVHCTHEDCVQACATTSGLSFRG